MRLDFVNKNRPLLRPVLFLMFLELLKFGRRRLSDMVLRSISQYLVFMLSIGISVVSASFLLAVIYDRNETNGRVRGRMYPKAVCGVGEVEMGTKN